MQISKWKKEIENINCILYTSNVQLKTETKKEISLTTIPTHKILWYKSINYEQIYIFLSIFTTKCS